MGMQIGVQEGEEGEFVDFPGLHHPAGVPVPPFTPEGKSLALEQSLVETHRCLIGRLQTWHGAS